MKILTLKALNINSLKGRTEIDFSELTKESSLFAITGPTGSGKSTLLDIISCSLYGRTPRLKNPNDLMSRHSGESYCEVEFEIKGEVYRSSWTQKRARKRHDGKFQTAKMELSNYNTGKVIVTGLREVPKYIEELSGLDFGRFTESMMLAQGGFDAFLKADERDRSALLEKITGTQVYADISRLVYEKYSDFQKEIDSDLKVMESIELLDEEILKEKEKLLSQNIAQKLETDAKLKELTIALYWVKRLHELNDEYQKHKHDFLEVIKLKKEHKNSFETLALAKKALNVSSTFRSYRQLQKLIIVDKDRSINFVKDLILLEEDIEKTDLEYSTLKEEFKKENIIFEAEKQKLKEVREIQVQEREKHQNIVKVENLLKSKKRHLTDITKKFDLITQDFNKIQQQVERKKLYLLTNAKDKKLLSILGVMEQNINEHKSEIKNLTAKQNDLEALNSLLLSENREYMLKKEEVERLSVIFKDKELTYKNIEQNSLNNFKEEDTFYKNLQNIETLIRVQEHYTQYVKKNDAELREHEKNSDLLNYLTNTRTLLQQYIDEIKRDIETLRDKKEREQLLKKYEEDRANLLEGEACFLCGSIEHPYVKGLSKVHIDITESMIFTQLKKLEDKESALKELSLQIGVTQTKVERSKLELQKIDKEIKNSKNIFKKNKLELSDNSEIMLRDRESELTIQLSKIKQERIKKDELLKQRDEASQQLQIEKKLLDKLETTLQKYSSEKEQFTSAIIATKLKIEDLIKSLELQVKEFDLDSKTIDTQYLELVEREKLYAQTLKDLSILESKLNSSHVDKKESETNIISITIEIETSTESLEELKLSSKLLLSKQIEILNVADLDVYEQHITAHHKMAYEREQFSKTTLNELKIKKMERLANKKNLDKKILEDEKKLHILNDELEDLYQKNGFKDAQALENATLNTKKREALDILCKDIEEKYTQIKTLKIETRKKLQEHKKKFISNKSIEELKTLQAILEQKTDALQENIGSYKKELEVNRENSEKYREKIIALKKKKDTFKIWIKLNELIGSADGTKFKKFAQGITLDQLINLANQHLQFLSSRYSLVRNQNRLLEIDVIDAYQGNVIRPVSTLSGGESFIVSLALALGLSELASQKIAIDSLFLDEGFGTLDEESLETALNALNLLQSGGKMVGVISHVEALKEWIPLQIKVIPNGDGTSFIKQVYG